MVFLHTKFPWIFLYVSLLHLGQGVLVLVAQEVPVLTTFMLSLRWDIPWWLLASLLIGSSLLFGCLACFPRFLPWYGLLVAPQQFLLLMSAFGGLVAIYQEEYVGGVQQPWYYILVNQLPALLLGIFHTAAILDVLATPQLFRPALPEKKDPPDA